MVGVSVLKSYLVLGWGENEDKTQLKEKCHIQILTTLPK